MVETAKSNTRVTRTAPAPKPAAVASPGEYRVPAVLQVVPALVTGGVERGTADVSAALVQAGWRSVVVSAGGPMVHEIERAGGL
ncbi:MAG TPA: glycosyl transferase, partial [Alphaproteobacteria bacterium]